MSIILECVPNFSEGKDLSIVEKISIAVSSQRGVKLLDINADKDHHRSVITFIGEPKEVIKAALAAAEKALELIDIRYHSGIHPRIGVVDVVPFVPIRGISMKEAIKAACEFGLAFAERFQIPVFLYGEAARNEANRELANIRRGGIEGLKRRIEKGEIWPDFGPSLINERSGATITGARMPLIAYNINLDSSDLELAHRIARLVRERNGGFPGVRALGLYLASRGIVQVSMNITDFRLAPLVKVFEKVKAEASKAGVKVIESELVGLAPADALSPEVARDIQLKGFSPRMLIEHHLS
ncbi:MAG: glutamate formimidoyltransferase [Syntrophales bacterium]|nr:glutamate formimidoyltransferase [Syntrophales bacterium]